MDENGATFAEWHKQNHPHRILKHMTITRNDVAIFSRYRGNYDWWQKSCDAGALSKEAWDLMDELMGIKMKERGIEAVKKDRPHTEKDILAYCDNDHTAHELVQAAIKYSNPRTWGFWSRVANWRP